MFHKILVASPTAYSKHYCAREWIENVMNFTYPNYYVRLYDNTDDKGKSAKYYNDIFKEMYGENNDKFKCINSLELNKVKGSDSIIERMALSHNDCRNEALNNGCSALLHLESDIFPPKDVIENLMSHNKRVIGALYYRDNGKSRKPMLQRHIYPSLNSMIAQNFLPQDDVCFVDGQVKAVASIGLGCVLIKKDILKKIPFRFVKGVDLHPDCHFSEDCFRNKITIHVDTAIVCAHENVDWGVFGVDYK